MDRVAPKASKRARGRVDASRLCSLILMDSISMNFVKFAGVG